MTPNTTPCDWCGTSSYDGSRENPPCPWCNRPRKYHGSREELVEANRDLLAALIEAEKMLTVAMGEDLVFGEKATARIIEGHSGMKQIRAAIAKAKGESK